MIMYAMKFTATRSYSLLWRGVVGIFAAGAFFDGAVFLNDIANPIEEVFQTRSITIPDFCPGENPTITVSRISRETMHGRYHSYYQEVNVSGVPLLPFDSPTFLYKPKDDLLFQAQLSDYMGRFPSLRPGKYYAVISHQFFRKWHNDAPVERASNVFQVFPSDHVRCGRLSFSTEQKNARP